MRLTSVLNTVSWSWEIQLQGMHFTKQCSTAPFSINPQRTPFKNTLTSAHHNSVNLPILQKRGQGLLLLILLTKHTGESSPRHSDLSQQTQPTFRSSSLPAVSTSLLNCTQNRSSWLAKAAPAASKNNPKIRFLTERRVAHDAYGKRRAHEHRKPEGFNSAHTRVHAPAAMLSSARN